MTDRKPLPPASLHVLIVTVLSIVGQGIAVATLSWQTSLIVALAWLASVLTVVVIDSARIGRRKAPEDR